ncbi:hypothetical protein BaRGS_00013875, partial [Batillaria attramentaria]
VKFTFLNLTEETVTRSENSTLSLLFKTDSLEKCNDWTLLQNMTISVSKAEEGSTMPAPVTFPVAIASGAAALTAVIGLTVVVLMACRFSKRGK